MASRVIETDEAGIAESYFEQDGTCGNLDCNCAVPEAEAPLTVCTSAEVDGEVHTDWTVSFCSLDCMNVFLSESFPLETTPSDHPSVQVFKPDL